MQEALRFRKFHHTGPRSGRCHRAPARGCDRYPVPTAHGTGEHREH